MKPLAYELKTKRKTLKNLHALFENFSQRISKGHDNQTSNFKILEFIKRNFFKYFWKFKSSQKEILLNSRAEVQLDVYLILLTLYLSPLTLALFSTHKLGRKTFLLFYCYYWEKIKSNILLCSVPHTLAI